MGLYFAVDNSNGRKIANVCSQMLMSKPGSEPGRYRKRLEMMIKEMLPEPNVGELQFLATTDTRHMVQSDVFEKSGDILTYKRGLEFDGWVFPDGSKFLKSDFPNAYEVFGGESNEWFRVPNLVNFFKLNPGIDMSNSSQSVARRHVIGQHSHDIGSDEPLLNDVIIENAISVYESPNHGNVNAVKNIDGVPVPYLCPGYNPTAASYYDFSNDPVQDFVSPFAVDVMLTSNVLLPDQTDEAGTSNEAYPTHVKLPVMVYIGRKLVEDLD